MIQILSPHNSFPLKIYMLINLQANFLKLLNEWKKNYFVL